MRSCASCLHLFPIYSGGRCELETSLVLRHRLVGMWHVVSRNLPISLCNNMHCIHCVSSFTLFVIEPVLNSELQAETDYFHSQEIAHENLFKSIKLQ